MNFVDFILVLIVLLAVLNGFSRGFFAGIAGLLAWLGTLILTFWTYPYVVDFVARTIVNNVWTIPISFLTCLLIIGLLLSSVTNTVMLTIPAAAHGNVFNKVLGIVPGFVVGVIYAAILASLFLLLPFSSTLTTSVRNSALAQPLLIGLQSAEHVFTPVFDEAVNRTINRMTIAPESTETIKLPFTVSDATARPDLEVQMLDLINEERRKVGLSELIVDDELREVARAHSADMFEEGYFSHISPDGNTPFDRIRAAGIPFLVAGENLAIAQTVQLAHQGLMNSPGHRANILRPAFGRVGIAILDGGVYGLMVTQKFRD